MFGRAAIISTAAAKTAVKARNICVLPPEKTENRHGIHPSLIEAINAAQVFAWTTSPLILAKSAGFAAAIHNRKASAQATVPRQVQMANAKKRRFISAFIEIFLDATQDISVSIEI
jgi:hypothetical protein